MGTAVSNIPIFLETEIGFSSIFMGHKIMFSSLAPPPPFINVKVIPSL